ncbi:MAG TPA: TetR/AcrR family transcriptional regulator [Steroidobacteraceae bacterium]|nr:TetR/AcrR family transcriptional regulator [Steroidobacteraceae bacterium]
MRSEDRTTVQQRTFTEEARREQIIACAIEVLAELGYAQTSFARIAERLGISKSVISYHFGGKDELLEQVVLAVYAHGAQYMIPRIKAQHSARATLGTYLRSNLEFIRDHRTDIDAVTEIFLNVRRKDGSRRFAGGPGGMGQAVRPLQEILRRGQEEGAFAEFDTRTMAWAIRNLVDGLTRQRALDPEFDHDTCIDEMVALVDRATRKAAP